MSSDVTSVKCVEIVLQQSKLGDEFWMNDDGTTRRRRQHKAVNTSQLVLVVRSRVVVQIYLSLMTHTLSKMQCPRLH